MASALDSLTAQYTDSEGEEEKEAVAQRSPEVSVGLADRLKVDSGTPGSSQSGRSTPKKNPLVAYNDPDAGLSDEDRESIPMDLESDAESDRELEEANGHEDADAAEKSHIMEELWSEGVKLPPEPSGQCSRDLQEKIEKMWRRKVDERIDFNYMIQNKKAFRNPSIYEKLIDHLSIDELGTNFPPELYDGHLFGKESYYEELAKAQKAEMDKREKAAEAQKKKMGDVKMKDAAPAAQQRKSKWDQGGSTNVSTVPGIATLGLPASLAKVIPAFGTLKKK
eukprot:TRINITY_DN79163_c0_g1_i1.p1 TRINITY_DN79163_c0_g1~~TRINITY_DN79163_c0_g1_i1.p1  ORF type:complete len:280 (-),score=66.52 TRINITY_DN79163_c0_g1_i1:309-1148(-)